MTRYLFLSRPVSVTIQNYTQFVLALCSQWPILALHKIFFLPLNHPDLHNTEIKKKHFSSCSTPNTKMMLRLLLLLLLLLLLSSSLLLPNFFNSQLWLGNIHLSWDVVINRIRLGGLICSLKSFLQLKMCQELQIFAVVYMYWGASYALLLLLLLLSSSSSSSSLPSSPLCRVFILVFLKQTMSLGNTKLQLFCCFYSWCLYRYLQCWIYCTFILVLSEVCVQRQYGCFL